MPDVGRLRVEMRCDGFVGVAFLAHASNLHDIVIFQLGKVRALSLVRWLSSEHIICVTAILGLCHIFKVFYGVVRGISVDVIHLVSGRAISDKSLGDKAVNIGQSWAKVDPKVTTPVLYGPKDSAGDSSHAAKIADFVELVVSHWPPYLVSHGYIVARYNITDQS